MTADGRLLAASPSDDRVAVWTLDEMRTWQSAAGLLPRKPIQLRFAREFGLQVADRAS